MTEEVALQIKNLIAHVQDTLFVLGGKWKLPIIIAIKHGNHRFKDIKEFVPKITNRVLSAELKSLEANKLITRTVCDTSSITVEYKITEYALSVKEVVNTMGDWGANHRKKIK
ncbi:winged helix-turn-helix transcriptional regulator [Flavobacterium eburneipallidum]|uniref:winged helix-turn-helix transcriptional regulator n=1 Tax=Flavobacterium eburneipallidum TaxID=3003263 RepID=UPI00248265EF|nr:helix-turn-helix domain-containing protein [Flavobacterium eburneipallidum]